MITVECPCCANEVRIELDAAELSCGECAVTAQIAPDEPARVLAAAA